jgi:hypothetical protein
MRNLFLLPTEKPSRLIIQNGNRLILGVLDYAIIENRQHIYITNSEEPKLDEWGINLHNNVIFNCKGFASTEETKKYHRKIILTTDPDLINDGVQAIDDTFLEWFVKNPSCESVEVNENITVIQNESLIQHQGSKPIVVPHKIEYKIIIPHEEPKYIGDKFEFESRIINEVWDKDEESKKETSEESSENKLRTEFETLIKNKTGSNIEFLLESNNTNYISWLENKWQAERMYREEEILNFADFYHQYRELIKMEKWEIIEMSKEDVFKKWFEQNKK